jgi:hypothetical protein
MVRSSLWKIFDLYGKRQVFDVSDFILHRAPSACRPWCSMPRSWPPWLACTRRGSRFTRTTPTRSPTCKPRMKSGGKGTFISRQELPSSRSDASCRIRSLLDLWLVWNVPHRWRMFWSDVLQKLITIKGSNFPHHVDFAVCTVSCKNRSSFGEFHTTKKRIEQVGSFKLFLKLPFPYIFLQDAQKAFLKERVQSYRLSARRRDHFPRDAKLRASMVMYSTF